MFAKVQRKVGDGPAAVAGDEPETVHRIERMVYTSGDDVYTLRGEGSDVFQSEMHESGYPGFRRYNMPDDMWDDAAHGDLLSAMAFPENRKEQEFLEELTGLPVPIVRAPDGSRVAVTTTKMKMPSAKELIAWGDRNRDRLEAEAEAKYHRDTMQARKAADAQARAAAQKRAARTAQELQQPVSDSASGRRLPGVTTMQSHEARELTIHAPNNEDLWNRRRPEFLKNLIRRKLNGTYDSAKAVKLWEYFADEVAKSYTREYGNGVGFGIFTKAQRREAAQEFRDDFENEWAFGGFHDHNPELFPKGHTTMAKKKAKKKATRKKPRTAAQKRATKKLIAANKKKSKKRTKKKATKKKAKKRTKKKATKKRATKKKATKRSVQATFEAAKRKGAARTVYFI